MKFLITNLILLFLIQNLLAHGAILTLDMKSMNPHMGQKFQVRVVDTYDNREVARKTIDAISASDFMVFMDGIQHDRNYNIDFYADHNGNGKYDNPPADHTWRIVLNGVEGDTIVPFTHNTNFTALDWQEAITLEMKAMNPHLGQLFQARLIDRKTMLEVSRDSVNAIEAADFEIVLPGIIEGESYFVDFFSDHNGNGIYDAPPADHAWRLEAEKVTGDLTLSFTHNTNFKDIDWKYNLALQLAGMTPHVGQMLEVRVTDRLTGIEVGRTRVQAIPQADFEVHIPGIEANGLYRVDFFADHNGNGLYNDPPTDHTWRLDVSAEQGQAIGQFSHNTNFTPLGWNYRLFLELKNMSPHLNQQLEVRIVEQSSGVEVGRKKLPSIYDDELTVIIPGVQTNTNYNVDFYADLNGNGVYDSPPEDHAWRETYNPGDDGENDISFSHNTNFTDISWAYNVTLNLLSMNPHIGQMFEMRLINISSGTEIGRKSVESIPAANFSISIPGAVPGANYNVDFYADHNGNGSYDAPPADHAWRETFTAATGDESIDFTHNTNFVDIGITTALGDENIQVTGTFKLYNNYPNPFNPETTIRFSLPQNAYTQLSIYNIMGQKIRTLVQSELVSGEHQYKWNGTNESGITVGSGIYFYVLEAGSNSETGQMTLVK
ncbi:MAG: T9SS type A sorting domain-containing protein [Calditrichae bacterium]|nr:T9SS type A sorting domain-containing protein [Calditrichia bacterium]